MNEFKQRVCFANKSLQTRGLVKQTWGNVSELDREQNKVYIKPSGVPYDALRPEDIVAVDVVSGVFLEGNGKPSTDLPTHLELYRTFPNIGGIAHVHSTYAVAWAQSESPIMCLGTTHADCFNGEIPLTRGLTVDEVAEAYEKNTGKVICELFAQREIKTDEVPGVLVSKHGPFTWGASAKDAVENAYVLEAIAEIAYLTVNISPHSKCLPMHIQEKHFERKHGDSAYYGQRQ